MKKLDFRLGRHLTSYQKEDSSPTRIWPLSASAIQALDTSTQGTTARNISIINLILVAFFFFLCPGEYCKDGTYTAQQPFSIKNVQFFIEQKPHHAATTSNAVLAQANFISLMFTTQKNIV